MGNLFWLDIETTGLVPHADKILEIGVIVTTPKLDEVADFQFLIEDPVIDKTIDKLARENEYVFNMHEKSGLLEDLLNPEKPKLGFLDIKGSLQTIIRELGCNGVEPDGEVWRSPICGATPSFDRGFLEHQVKGALAGLSHRHFDVSTFAIADAIWYKEPYEPKPDNPHRAIDDLRYAIDRARWYKKHRFACYGVKNA